MSAPITPREAWLLERYRAKGAPIVLSELTSELAREAAAAMLAANGKGPDGELNRWLNQLDPEIKRAIQAAMIAVDLDDEEGPGAAGDPRFIVHSAAEWLEPPPPIEWVVENFASAGTLGCVAGEGGLGKTFLLYAMLLATATGEPFLDFETTRAPALLLDEESGPDRIHRRFHALLRGSGVTVAPPLSAVSLAGIDPRKADDIAKIDHLIAATGARIVGIDPLIALLHGAEENSSGQMREVLNPLRNLMQHRKAAGVVLHHTNRQGGYRGASGIKDAVDWMYEAEKNPATDALDFRIKKVRDQAGSAFSARIHFDIGGSISVLPAGAPAPRKSKYNAGEDFVLGYLLKFGRASIETLMDNADTCSPGTARNGVFSLAKKGEIRRSNTGGKGSEAFYEITPPDAEEK